FAQAHGVARSYGSYRELVDDDDIDVVYVATTNAQHHSHALLALEAGKPVLVEKAFALNARQAREMVTTARDRGLFCMEGMWLRLNPLIRHAIGLIADGGIGAVVSVRADLSKRFPYLPDHRLYDLSAGGGALLDLGVYPLTLVWMLLGRPAGIAATGSLSPTGSDATVGIQCHYPGGPISQVHTSASVESPFAALVCGTDGWLRFETRVHRPTAVTVWTAAGEQVLDAAAARTAVAGPNGYGYEIAEVERCLRAGELESALVPLDDTVAVLDLIDEARAQLGVRYAADGPR
ncbi:MAG: Gfo/Idh/MocA family oxidoreductase, partial [Actinomycetota bacterium]|nr:Gfo/Idh/MocA family oxidoreductase [Actinomycetota bacterium]